ncbi:DUF262 domain-containing protein [Candidatus Neomarinimicrobiota bacterium]
MTLFEELDKQRRKVDFDTYDISVQQLLSMVGESVIDIAPEFQRHFRWEEHRQSQLIESIFLGIPVPSMFMATNRDASWEVVDGVQRLSTLIHFAGESSIREQIGLTDSLRIQNIEKLTQLNGKTFKELPKNIQVQFLLRPVKVVTLSDKSDTIVRFDLFERLNTGGVRLSDQEIRGCVFRGLFNDFLTEMAAVPEFRTVVNLPPRRRDDRYEEECVLRFFAFFHEYKSFEHSVVEFLNEYMRRSTENFDYKHGRALFLLTFSELAILFPEGIARPARKSTPINLYEGVAVGAGLAIDQNGKLPRLRNLDWVISEDLRKLTTGATNTPQMVGGRITFCAKRFGWKEES